MSKDNPPKSKSDLPPSSGAKTRMGPGGSPMTRGRKFAGKSERGMNAGSVQTGGLNAGSVQNESSPKGAWGDSFKGWGEGTWGGHPEISERINALRITDKDRAQFRPALDSSEVQLVREHIRKANEIAEGIADQSQRALAMSYLKAAEEINESPFPSGVTIIHILVMLMTCIANFNDLREFVENLIEIAQNIRDVL